MFAYHIELVNTNRKKRQREEMNKKTDNGKIITTVINTRGKEQKEDAITVINDSREKEEMIMENDERLTFSL